MNLKTKSDEALISHTEALVKKEREVLIEILHHLKEIDRRRLYSAYQYDSLFEFAVKRFGYSEPQAYRRISAMKLLKELPEIEDKIESGEINLSHINIAQSFFKKTELKKEEKLEVFDRISFKSIREAEKIAASFLDLPIEKPDRIQVISQDVIELKFQANEELRNKIETLKGYLAHKSPNLSLGELFEKLCDLGLQEWDPAKPATTSKKLCVAKSKAQVRREVFLKGKNQCENCGSRYALEIDHIQPKALGGSDEPSNLRLLCRCCNQRAAIKAFGVAKMERFLG